jgi:hypothetical protein
MNMSWNRRYALWSDLRSSLWFVPLIALLSEQIIFHGLDAVDEKLGWFPAWPFGPQGTQTTLQTIITLTPSFIVFTFGSMLVAIQVGVRRAFLWTSIRSLDRASQEAVRLSQLKSSLSRKVQEKIPPQRSQHVIADLR